LSRAEAIRIQKIMKHVRSQHPWPSSEYIDSGYFTLPSPKGSAFPLGFISTSGCFWAKNGGCTMCDYGGASNEVPEEKLVAQIDSFFELWNEEAGISLSALGCFFDDAELSPKVRSYLLNKAGSSKNLKNICVETRAEDITRDKLISALRTLRGVGFEVGFGVESSDEYIRNVCINKGLNLETLEKAVEMVHDVGGEVVLHVFLKPPFLTEREAIDDAVSTIEYCASLDVKRIVLMAANVKQSTFSGWLFQKGEYKTPWLWSILQVLQLVSVEAREITSVYGFKCGIPMLSISRNCSKCTDQIRASLDDFCQKHESKIIEEAFSVDCECKKEWIKNLETRPAKSLPQRVSDLCDLYEREFELL